MELIDEHDEFAITPGQYCLDCRYYTELDEVMCDDCIKIWHEGGPLRVFWEAKEDA